jgi:benzodiazapine receptor
MNGERVGKLRILAGCLTGTVASAVIGSLAVDPKAAYYQTLDKPSWQPPPPVYGIVWTPLYADIALSAGHAISKLGEQDRVRERRSLIGALAVNLTLNTGWSWLFFRGHRPWLAAAECAVLALSSADLVRRVGAADRRAGYALAPYPLWCSFATALTVAIARRNPRAAIESRLAKA